MAGQPWEAVAEPVALGPCYLLRCGHLRLFVGGRFDLPSRKSLFIFALSRDNTRIEIYYQRRADCHRNPVIKRGDNTSVQRQLNGMIGGLSSNVAGRLTEPFSRLWLM